ncbi:MAG: hypothetical protein VZQ75_05695 [Candidatus Faecousia sp.]|nr:hypothetical protein [Candidatus Faecousia sp.]
MDASIAFIIHKDVNDPLNLKALIQMIGDFVRESRDSGSRADASAPPRNAYAFFRFVLSDIFPETNNPDEPRRLLLEAAILKLQKLLSGNLRPDNLRNGKDDVFDVIFQNESQVQLQANIRKLTDVLWKLQGSSEFFHELVRNVSPRYFTSSQKSELIGFYNEKNYRLLLFHIVRHAFETTNNLPVFFAERTYQEALLSEPQSPQQLALMRIAADNGHADAALIYGNYLKMQRRWNDAYTYFRKAVPGDCALWSIAELLEKGLIPLDDLDTKLQRTIEDMINDLPKVRYELANVECHEKNPTRYESLATAYKIYFVLAYQRGFSRAWNDLARMLESPLLDYPSTGWTDKNGMIRMYRSNAFFGTSAQALYDWADGFSTDLLGSSDASDGAKEEMRIWAEEMLEAAANLGSAKAAYKMALLQKDALHDTENSPLVWLNLALRLDSTGVNGNVYREMARLLPNGEKKTEDLKLAIRYGCADAAYDLAKLYFDAYLMSDREDYLKDSYRFLWANLNKMSEEVKSSAKKLLEMITIDGFHSNGPAGSPF